ncbi:hypothetical protein [Chitinophaga sp. S165]|uniref:hypothetical protein n=1 Tax=Chitinophaga sp. S165 TaxID=2135462 RepID=UPI000D99B734|nr:hypothetical protein [Chitinophaga sp. S165]PWV54482.1 hypothetical protein C7475_1021241 [Chitinophaga sp. S165]
MQSIQPAPTSSHHDFDFLAGQWHVRNRKLKSRLDGCTEWDEFDATQDMRLVLHGIGNTDILSATVNDQPFEGITLRLFNPASRLWSIYWADSNRGVLEPPVVGSFAGDTGLFFADDVFNGQKILVKFNWDKTDPDAPVWSQAFSTDDGATWEWNWYMYFTRM